MARGARLSGYDPEDEEMAEFEELQRLKERPEDMSWLDRAKLSVEKLVERVGFMGILACASVSEQCGTLVYVCYLSAFLWSLPQ